MESTAIQTFSEMRHELARTGLGGSDAAAVHGLNPFSSQFDVWMTCTGRKDADEQSEPAEWGNRLESEVLRKYAEGLVFPFMLVGRGRDGRVALYERHGDKIKIVQSSAVERDWGHLFETLRHPDYPHLMAHIDAVVINCETGQVVKLIDAKTTGHFRAQSDDWGDAESDEVPPEYIVQVNHYGGILAANGHPIAVADVPVLKAGQTYEVYTVPIDPIIIAENTRLLDSWWNTHVVADTPPPVVSGDNPSISTLFPEDHGHTVTAPDELNEPALTLAGVKAELKELGAHKSELEAQIKIEIGDASVIVGDGWQATWKQAKASIKTDFASVVQDIRDAIDLGVEVTADVLSKAVSDRTTEKQGSRRFVFKATEVN